MKRQEFDSEGQFAFRPFEQTSTDAANRLIIEPDWPMGKMVRVVGVSVLASFAIASIPLFFVFQTPSSVVPSEAELWKGVVED